MRHPEFAVLSLCLVFVGFFLIFPLVTVWQKAPHSKLTKILLAVFCLCFFLGALFIFLADI